MDQVKCYSQLGNPFVISSKFGNIICDKFKYIGQPLPGHVP